MAANGTSLTVVVPVNATTGSVRLERDRVGLLLQIVPTITNVSMGVNGGFIGGTLTLRGSGFAEGATAVLLGGRRVDDVSRDNGLDVQDPYNYTLNRYDSNGQLSVTVPNGAPNGPIRVSTVGGTSTAFGLSLGSIGTSAGSGSPADLAKASANPGQAITLNGTSFDTSLDVVFQTIAANGDRGELVVRPTTVNAAGARPR